MVNEPSVFELLKVYCIMGPALFIVNILSKMKQREYSNMTRMFNADVQIMYTIQILCIGTDRSQQTVQTKIRLLLKKQSDQGLCCLPFHHMHAISHTVR